MALSYYIATYGCQMNAHESEKIAGMLQSRGYAPGSREDADIIVFNTCCIRDSAEKKISGNIGVVKHLKEKKNELIVIVCGCMTQQKGFAERLIRRFPFIDAALGTNYQQTFPQVLDAVLAGEKHIVSVKDDIALYESEPVLRTTFPSAYVNIMYGCNNYCTYCIVPYVRGRERSRTSQAIIADISSLAEQGFKEVTLLGQNVNSYAGDVSFPNLLRMIDERTCMPRIRFMTSHPKDLSDDLIEAMRLSSVCNHIHLPVQSGSDRILKLMNRRYTREHYLNLVDKLRVARPGIAITTDAIVGFPTETDEDFEDTLSLFKAVGFDSAFTFKYSKRTGTAAASMDGQVPDEVKTARINELVAFTKELSDQSNARDVGKTLPVLAERANEKDGVHFCGRTDTNKMVNFLGNDRMAGKIINMKITKANRTTLLGEVMGDEWQK